MKPIVNIKSVCLFGALAIFAGTSSAPAGLQVAGQVLIDVHAARGVQTDGGANVLYWTNYGTVGGVFATDGAATTHPTVADLGGQGAVTFNGSQRLRASFVAPDFVTGQTAGKGNMYSIEYWIYNPAVAGEEWVLTLARRGTSPRFGGFGYGTSAAFGFAGHGFR